MEVRKTIESSLAVAVLASSTLTFSSQSEGEDVLQMLPFLLGQTGAVAVSYQVFLEAHDRFRSLPIVVLLIAVDSLD